MTEPARPLPRLAAAILSLAAARGAREDVLADLEEEYGEVARERGLAALRTE